MEKKGWIWAWRKILDSPVWSKPRIYLHVWMWILLSVDRKTGRHVTSISQIADGVSTFERHAIRIPSKKIILDVLKWLEAEKMINRESNGLGTTLDVVNWSIYQSEQDKKVTQREPLSEPRNGDVGSSINMFELTEQEHVAETGTEVAKILRSTTEVKQKEAKNIHVDPDVASHLAEPSKQPDYASILEAYRSKIHQARMTNGAREKIRTRLKTYTEQDLLKAIDKFSADPWWMENNSHRGIAWFFHTDDRIEQFLNLSENGRAKSESQSLSGPEAVQRYLERFKKKGDKNDT